MELKYLIVNFIKLQRSVCTTHVHNLNTFSKQECHENYDQVFASKFKQLLRGESSAALVSASHDEDYISECKFYILDHLQQRNCPSNCDVLWLVYMCIRTYMYIFLSSLSLVYLQKYFWCMSALV